MDTNGNRLYSGDIVIEVKANGKCRRFKNQIEADQHIFAMEQMGRRCEISRRVWR